MTPTRREPETFRAEITHDERGWTAYVLGPDYAPEMFGPEIDPPALMRLIGADLEDRDLERFVRLMREGTQS